MKITCGNIEYEFDRQSKKIDIYYRGGTLTDYITRHLTLSSIFVNNPLDQTKKGVMISPDIRQACIDVFDAIKHVKQVNKDEELAAYLAAHLFERFTIFWLYELLGKARDILGIHLWQSVLAITEDWEKTNGVKIHTGTPNFFLAENYLLLGNTEQGFLYLYQALEDDKILNQLAPVFCYPDKAPAYYTATMRAEQGNHMYYIV